MQMLYMEAKWEKPIVFGKQFLDHITKEGIKSIALFAATQFTELDGAKKQLTDIGVAIHITKAKRTHVPMQILGCDAYHDSFEEDVIGDSDAVVYVGDGLFHPKALLLSQIYKKTIKPVLIWDPVISEMRTITVADVQLQINRTRSNLMKFMNAKTVGILVTVKPGQQYLHNAKKLKLQLDKEGKKAYIFIDDDVMLSLLENYPFIDAWVNTACPRIGTDDHVTINKPLINIREAYDPKAALRRLIL